MNKTAFEDKDLERARTENAVNKLPDYEPRYHYARDLALQGMQDAICSTCEHIDTVDVFICRRENCPTLEQFRFLTKNLFEG